MPTLFDRLFRFCLSYNSSCFCLAAPVLFGGNPQKPDGKPFTSLSRLAKAVNDEMQLPMK